ncbi:MAG: hypothetical protein CL908_13780 [Deltaproteobacteria bacterium]|nr:hypothetical protein [Deltaproteobacteria bacterium]
MAGADREVNRWMAGEMSVLDLTGKVAIVTGAAQGIGRGIAVELARAGCDVAIGDLLDVPALAEGAGETVEQVEALGRRAASFDCDVSQEPACRRLVESTIEALGTVDILVCNAGVMQIGGVADITREQWQRVLDVNLTGAFLCCQAVLPHMSERGQGAIVNVASVVGLRTGRGRVAYSASKFGVVGLTQSLASEVASQGIRVNCVCPSFVRSSMSIGEMKSNTGIEDDAKADAAWTRLGESRLPIGRSVEPRDIGEAVVWLCQSETVVGISLPVTGGDGLP